jgi:TonB-linked SusC/RagA family outer membrane protein
VVKNSKRILPKQQSQECYEHPWPVLVKAKNVLVNIHFITKQCKSMHFKTTAFPPLIKGVAFRPGDFLAMAMTKQIKRIMRLTAILLFSACLSASAKMDAQGISLSLKEVPIEKVFQEIKKQSGMQVLYTRSMIKDAAKVSVDIKNASLETALQEILKNQKLGFTIINNTIVIKERETAPNGDGHSGLDPGSFSQLPPPIDVTGKVTDADGNPLAGATVKVKGSNKATTTNSDGVFTLRGVSDDATLEISFVGYEKLTVDVNNKTAIVASLKIKPESLNEVVINKGYYSEKQRMSVGNVTHIDSKVIEQQPVQNPLLALAGRVPGLEVTQQTGLSGGAVKVQIQGVNTLRYKDVSAISPLIVVDGIPYPNQLPQTVYDLNTLLQGGSPLNYINSSDIESIDILKDADATSIYGSRAANGAILITTKKGKIGKTQLNLNFQQGWGRVGHFVDMMNTPQYLKMRWEGLRNSKQIPSSNPSASSPLVYAPDLLFWDTARNTNWQKTLIGGTAHYTDIDASLTGGTSTVQYVVGGSFKRQTTVFPGDFDDKLGACHFNISGTSPNQRLRLQLGGSYSYDQNHLPQTDLTNISLVMEPDAPPLFNSNGTLNWAQNGNGTSTWSNPLSYINSTDFVNNAKNLVSNLLLNYKVLRGLTLTSNFGYTNLQTDVSYLQRLEYSKPENRTPASRSAAFGNRNMSTWIIEPQLQYSHKISKGNLDAFVGSTIQKSSYDFLYVVGSGYSNDLLMNTLTAATTVNVQSNVSGITRFNALFGRVGYNWSEKYLINLTGRRDGSNKFGDANKYHNFWGVGGGWIFSQEKWLQQNLSIISFGKLRTSYGTTGNDNIPDFSYLSVYDISNPTILYQGNIGLNANSIANPHLQWEETRKWQTGLDLGFIGDRVDISATYVRNRSSNQLVQYTLPNLTGFSSFLENLPATIQNTSWEFIVSSVNVKLTNFSWTSSANLTIPRNRLVSFPGIENTSYASGGAGVKIGQPIGVIQTSHYAGVNPVNGFNFFLDQNGTPNNDLGGQDVYLSTQPRFYGGLINSFSYKAFQFDFLFQFVKKMGARDMYFFNGNKGPGNFLATSSNQPVTILDHWQKPGDIKNISLYLSSGNTASTVKVTDAFYSYDASYVRLKNLSLSWQFPSALLKKTHIQTARLYIHGQNLLTISKYSGLDPETMSLSNLPPLRMVTTGVQIGF